MTAPRRLSPEDLAELMRLPANHLRVAPPTVAEMAVLASMVGPGPIRLQEQDRSQIISKKPRQQLIALKNSLVEVDAYWMRLRAMAEDKASQNADWAATVSLIDATAIVPLKRLRDALNECETLVAPIPESFDDSYEFAARGLWRVYCIIVGNRGKIATLSLTGPAMRFICAGLKHLGWREGRQPTDSTIYQYLLKVRAGRSELTEGEN